MATRLDSSAWRPIHTRIAVALGIGWMLTDQFIRTLSEVETLNRELEALSSFDPIVFEHDEPPPDHLLSVYLKEKIKKA